MADDWKPEGARELPAEDWKPVGARPLGPTGPMYGPEAPPPQMGRAQAALKGVQNIPTMGFGDELGALEQATLLKLSGDPSTWSENYRQARRENRQEDAQARKDRPGYYYGAGGLAAIPALAITPTISAAKGAGLGARLLTTAANGAIFGGVSGLGDSEADLTKGEFGQAKDDVLSGAAKGAALGTALHATGAAGVYGVKKLVNGIAQRSPAAKLLISKGVQGLTVGQQAPRSALNKLEDTATSAPLVGHDLEAAREASRRSWEDVVFNQGRAPGAPPPIPEGDLGDRLASIHEGFGPAYDAVGKAPVKAVGPGGVELDKVFDAVTKDPGVRADDAVRNSMRSWLLNQWSALPNSLDSTSKATAQDLMSLRSKIRAERASAMAAQDNASASFLRNAEHAVTSSLEEQLPAQSREALRAADTAYSRYKVVEDAVAKSKDQVSRLTPAKLSDAVRRGVASKGTYARGGGGDLRELAQAGHEVFDSVAPKTGARGHTLPFPLNVPVAAGFEYLNGSPRLQNALFGETRLQQGAQKLGEFLTSEQERNAALAEAIQRIRSGSRLSLARGAQSALTPSTEDDPQ